MIDNICIVLPVSPPRGAINAKGRPFEIKGSLYTPKYRNGELRGYESSLGNLKIYISPQSTFLTNSLHKFYKGNNYTDFYLSEILAAIEGVTDATGWDWGKGRIKKLEYGCNILGDGTAISGTLESYLGKNYLPMAKNGKVYGKTLDAAKYTLKGYDKRFQVKQVDRLSIAQTFRWEVIAKHGQYLERLLNTNDLQVKKVFQKSHLQLLANDAVQKFETGIKTSRMNLQQLTAEQKKILAVMLNAEIRQDFKQNHREAYKKYGRVYRLIMDNSSLILSENTSQKIREKLTELLDG